MIDHYIIGLVLLSLYGWCVTACLHLKCRDTGIANAILAGFIITVVFSQLVIAITVIVMGVVQG